MLCHLTAKQRQGPGNCGMSQSVSEMGRIPMTTFTQHRRHVQHSWPIAFMGSSWAGLMEALFPGNGAGSLVRLWFCFLEGMSLSTLLSILWLALLLGSFCLFIHIWRVVGDALGMHGFQSSFSVQIDLGVRRCHYSSSRQKLLAQVYGFLDNSIKIVVNSIYNNDSIRVLLVSLAYLSLCT